MDYRFFYVSCKHLKRMPEDIEFRYCFASIVPIYIMDYTVLNIWNEIQFLGLTFRLLKDIVMFLLGDVLEATQLLIYFMAKLI